MGKVTFLTERAEILIRVVRRIMVKMRGCQNDLRELRQLQQREIIDNRGLPQNSVATSIPAMAGAAEFAFPPGSIKSDFARDFPPVRRVQRPQFWSDWHLFSGSFRLNLWSKTVRYWEFGQDFGQSGQSSFFCKMRIDHKSAAFILKGGGIYRKTCPS